MNRLKKILLSLIGALLIPTAVQAAVFIDHKESATTKSETDNDLFIASRLVDVIHEVKDDVFAVGETVNVKTLVGDVFMAGNTLSFNGASQGDIFSAGNTIKIEGTVGDDLMVIGNDIRIVTESVEDIMAAGNIISITSAQPVAGDVFVAGSLLTLASIVEGDVKMAGEKILISSGSHIKGNLKTYGDTEPVIEDGVTIDGEVSHSKVVNSAGRHEVGFSVGSWVQSVVAWFVLAMILFYLVKSFTGEVVEKAMKNSGRSLGLGALWMFMFGPSIALLIISVIGMPFAILLLLITGVLFVSSLAFAMIVTGGWVMKNGFKREEEITWQQIMLGVVVFKGAQQVPYIGWPVSLIVTLLAMGALIIILKDRLASIASVKQA